MIATEVDRIETIGPGGLSGTRGVTTQYQRRLVGRSGLMAVLPALRGKTLADWCAPEPWHGAVLRMSNG